MVTDTQRISSHRSRTAAGVPHAYCQMHRHFLGDDLRGDLGGRTNCPYRLAWTPRAAWPSGSSPTTRRPEKTYRGAHGRPGTPPPHPRRGRGTNPAHRRGHHDRGSGADGPALTAAAYHSTQGSAEDRGDDERATRQPVIQPNAREHRWLHALLILATLTFAFVVIDYAGSTSSSSTT